jgi:hypothetical protein
MTQLIERFKRWLERKINGPTIQDTIKTQKIEHRRTLQHSVNTIYSHAFQEHMARAQLRALEDWESQQPDRIFSEAYRPSGVVTQWKEAKEA